MRKVFILHAANQNFNRTYYANAFPFEGVDLIGANMMGVDNFVKPDIIYLYANISTISPFDLLDNDMGICILSSKLMALIKDCGIILNYTIIPIALIDENYIEYPFDKTNTLRSNVCFKDNYSALQLKNYTDAFDYKKSEFEDNLVFPGEVGYIYNLVLNNSKAEFPPIFKIKEAKEYLFVTSEVKEAVENSGITGCVFEEIELSN